MRTRRLKTKAGQGGFTLFEVIFAVMILGILSMALSPAFRTLMMSRDIAYVSEQTAINQKIANALVTYAEYGSATPGVTTSPCHSSTNKVFYAIYNPTLCSGTSALRDYLQQQGVSLSQVNDDGTAAKNLRVFQRLGSESQTAYLFYQSGPMVFLNYDYGVIYMTNCGQSQPCNQTAASSTSPPKSQPTMPGDTATTAGAVRLTTSNRSTWVPGTRDIGVTYVSTLPLQKKMLQTTADQLDRIRTALTNYYASMQAANPSSTANFYPQPTDPLQRAPADPDPLTNQGCREGWYQLSNPVIDILPQIGIGGGTEFGFTPFGAAIEYCRDYDPTAASGYGNAPHYAALRINRAVSLKLDPDNNRLDPAAAANNIVISF